MTGLTLEVLNEAEKGSAAAFRCRRRLQPAGGDGDKVFPRGCLGGQFALALGRLDIPGGAEFWRSVRRRSARRRGEAFKAAPAPMATVLRKSQMDKLDPKHPLPDSVEPLSRRDWIRGKRMPSYGTNERGM